MTFIGYQTGLLLDPGRPDWDGLGQRPIAWAAWYPSDRASESRPPQAQVFDPGQVVLDAPIAQDGPYPVTLLSHGTGGCADSLGWLARALAAQGRIVLAANHHGNTSLEPYRPEGFLCWWERATDLSVLLSDLAAAGAFADQMDMSQVSAIGFSLGSYAVLALAGAQTSMAAFGAWQQTSNLTPTGPREFPDLLDHIQTLSTASQPFQASWARQGDPVADPRIGAVVAIAPPPPVRSFRPETVAKIDIPILILTGGDDVEAPSAIGADWLCALNPGFRHYDLGGEVGHYTFLDLPADRSLLGQDEIFTDRPGIDRRDVHARTAAMVVAALAPPS